MHAIVSASGAHRWLDRPGDTGAREGCPGAVAMEDNYPKETSPYAEEGTVAHAVAAKCLEQGLSASGMCATAEMAEAVQVYVDFVQSLAGKKWYEERISLDFLFDGNPPTPLFGTADAVAVKAFEHICIVDYKHGAGVPVGPENNPQLMYYALGALHKHRWEMVSSVTLAVVQPRCAVGDAVQTWSIAPEELYGWGYGVLRPGVELAMSDHAPIRAGEWCRWCRARHACTAHAEALAEATLLAFDPKEETATVAELPEPRELDLEAQARVALNAKALKAWIDVVTNHAKERLVAGAYYPGMKLVEGRRTARKWLADEAAVKRALKGYDVTREKLLTPTQTEKELKEQAHPNPRMAVEALSAPGERTLSLVPESDTRPAVSGYGPIDFPELEAPK